jgi:hypothetical protein
MSVPPVRSVARFVLALASIAAVGAGPARAQETLVRFLPQYASFRDAETLQRRGVLAWPGQMISTDGAHVGGGVFYCVEGIPSDGQPDRLVRYDARTRTRTEIGSTGVDTQRRGVAYDRTSGTLYMFANGLPTLQDGVLHTIDLQTGIATAIASVHTLLLFPNTLTIDAQGRALLVTRAYTTELGPFRPKVQQLDLATAAITELGTFASVVHHRNFAIEDVAVRADGQLYVKLDDSWMYRLDPATLTGTAVDGAEGGADWLAIAPDADLGLAYA